VWLAFDVPGAEGAAGLLVLDDDAPAQAVMVTSTCGAGATGVSGPGRHQVAVPIDPGALGEAASCAVRLEPNFYVVAAEPPVHRALALEVLGWMPDEGTVGQ
jgi:hypothetical protein